MQQIKVPLDRHILTIENQNWNSEGNTEAATRDVLWKKVLLEISQDSQENTCVKASFLIKLQASRCYKGGIKSQLFVS